MAPVKIKHVVSFTSEDPEKCVANLCTGTSEGQPWLCSRTERSGLLKAELQLEQTSTIGYIDVGNYGSAFLQIDVGRSFWPLDHPYVTLLPTTTLMNPADSRHGTGKHSVRMFKKADFLPSGAAESWDRLRITCSQPFNKRCQFGLSFLRLRTVDEHTDKKSVHQDNKTEENQSTPERVISVREWISSPAVQHTFFSQKPGETSPKTTVKSPSVFTRAERMVTAAQSAARLLRRDSLDSLSNNDKRQGKNQEIKQGRDKRQVCKRKLDTSLQSASVGPISKNRVTKTTSNNIASKSGSKNENKSQHNTLKTQLSPLNSSDTPEPETMCPICGVTFSPDYLPVHASSCLDVGVMETSATLSLPSHSLSDTTSGDFMVPCPLCSIRLPTDCIQQHASTCGDTVWVD